MKKLIFSILIAIPMMAMMAFKKGDSDKKAELTKPQKDVELVDCIVKYKSKWGDRCQQCGNDNADTYSVWYKNTCSKKLDVMIGVQEESKSLRLSTFYGINSNDTIRVYACKGTGKAYKWAREAGDKSYSFPTQQEANDAVK